MMYWHIGERNNREVLGNQRAEYGKQIVAQLARKLFWMLYPYGDLLWTDMFGYVCLKQVNPKFARLCTMAYGFDKDWGLYCPKYLFLYDNQRILQTKQSLH